MIKSSHKQFILGFLGNSLEFYEFTIYGVFASQIALNFFPETSNFLALMYSWAIFSVGFIMRPTGAVLFGMIGDKFGRKIALTLSILLMAISTICIGLTPSYSVIGIYAPMILIFLRMMQGLSTGGEYNGVAIFLIEKFGEQKSGIVGGIITASCVVGALTGTLVGKKLLMLGDGLWRWGFIVGGMCGILIFMARFILIEAPVTLTHSAIKNELWTTIKALPHKFISNMILGGLNGALSYILFGFSLIYFKRYVGFSEADAFSLNIFGLLCFMFSSVIMGYVYDRVPKHMFLASAISSLFVMPFISLYLILSGSYILSMCGILIWGTLTGTIAGAGHAILQAGVPYHVRYRFVALSFSLGMGIAGGTTPAIMTFFIEKFQIIYAPSLWIAMLGSLFLIPNIIVRKSSSNLEKISSV